MAESRPLYTLLKLLQEQDLLKGDLNLGQRLGLNWVMVLDHEDAATMERIRLQGMALSGNPLTSEAFTRTLFEDERPKTEEEDLMENVEWVTPQSEAELEELERLLSGNR